MDNKLQIFKNEEFGAVRVVEIDNEPWFVAKDVASILGYTTLQRMYNHIDDEDKIKIDPQSKAFQGLCQNGGSLETNPNVRTLLIINESGLYDAIFGSKLPSAKKFKRWVTSEVLPSIRKHGAYMTDDVIDFIYNDPQAMIDLLTKLKNEKDARVEAERRNAILMHTKKTYTATEIAKELGFKSANALNKDLCDKGIQYKVNNTYVLYSDYAELGYVSIKQQILDNGKEVYNRHFTQDGRTFILDLYKVEKKAN